MIRSIALLCEHGATIQEPADSYEQEWEPYYVADGPGRLPER